MRVVSAEWHGLPDDVVRQIMLHYRMGVRKRLAQRRLAATRKRNALRELVEMFDFTHGHSELVLQLLGPVVSR